MTPLTRALARLLLPAMFVTAAAVLVKGYRDTGDGFSAGVIAAAGVVLQYVAFGAAEVERRLPVRLAERVAAGGLAVALAVGFAPLTWGGPPLTHVPSPGHEPAVLGALELHTAFLFDVGVCLLVLGFAVRIVRAIAGTPDAETAP